MREIGAKALRGEMMDFETVIFDVADGVATVTLNRPERMNAYSATLGAELAECMACCDEDDDVRAVVLTGAGRAFCAGADMAVGEETFGGGLSQFGTDTRRPGLKPSQVRKPVIAAINGHAVGIGMTIPMQCDIRIVAEDAKLGFVFVARGIIAEYGAHWIVPRLVGMAVAAELFYTGRIFSGCEAVGLGLASKALPAAEVLPAAQAMAANIAANAAPVSVAVTKRLLWESMTLERAESERRELALLAWLGQQPDSGEGVRAFLDKRPAKWTMRPSTDMPVWPG
ncbi:MAG: crotonase/enoyl-CoA hydratase family protein [Acidimicrobiales bacterium]